MNFRISVRRTTFKCKPCHSVGKQYVSFHKLFNNKKVVFIDLGNTVSHALLKTNQKWKVITKNKMDNPRFVDEEAIPLVRMNIMIVTVRGIQAG